MKQILTLGVLSLLLASCSNCPHHSGKIKTVSDAVANPARTMEFTKRDIYRHPIETLEFFGIKRDMTVLEIAPGAGWYMEILAPFLAKKGQYVMTMDANPTREYQIANAKQVQDWINANKKVKKNAKSVVLDPNSPNLGAANSFDMIVTFRNAHNWISSKTADKVFKEFHRVLKKGGVLGLTDHRANANAKEDLKTGYIKEETIIKIAKAAGFKLEAKSEINANPKDTKNHPNGVWSLPPSLRGDAKDQAKFQAIGESDRMTLKFVKI